MDRRLDLADVFLLFISSQSQGKAYSVADQIAGRKPVLDTRVFFFGDPEHLLVNHLIELGLSRPVITNPDSHRAHGWVFDYGMVQPAVVALGADSAVLYEWTNKPSLLNVAGKLDRPDPWDVWDRIERRIDRVRITRARAARKALAATTSIKNTAEKLSQGTESPDRPHETSIPNVAHLSMQSLASSHLIPHTLTPVKIQYPDNLPTSANETPDYQLPLADPNQPQHNPANDFLRQISDIPNAPLSTAIDTVTGGTSKANMAREETDVSADDMTTTARARHLSARINALNTEQIPKNSLSNTNPQPNNVEDIPRLAEQVVLAQQQVASLVDADMDDNLDHIAQITIIDNDHVSIANEIQHLQSDDDDHTIDSDDIAHRVADDTLDDESELSDFETSIPRDLAVPLSTPYADDFEDRGTGATLEHSVSVASMGSDQVDSSAIITKHASIRTDDSNHVNLLSYEAISFQSERDIPEEADDRKTGISDYLKELKDPTQMRDARYRKKYDPLPPLMPRGRLTEQNNRPRPLSTTEYSRAAELKASSAVPLSRNLVRKETGRTISGERRNAVGSDFIKDRSIVPIAEGKHLPKIFDARSPKTRFELAPGTGSPHPEVTDTGRPMLDVSPFADAENGLGHPEDALTRSSLRDEYEAYDEYIVCEYEVEEYVEEYESDAFSKSKVFVTTTVVEDSSHGESFVADLSRVTGNSESSKLIDPKRSGREMEERGKVRIWKGDSSKPNSPRATISPIIEENMIRRRAQPEGSHALGPVRRVLRRIRSPVLYHRKRSANRHSHTGSDGRSSDHSGTIEREGSRVSRKETFRAVLRKKPAGFRDRSALNRGGELEETVEPSPPDEHEDEGTAKLGRKETIKQVLRKLPMPKARKRSHTSEGVVEAEPQAEEGHLDESLERMGKRSGLHGVLQRLPSLNRGQRVSLKIEGVTSQRNLESGVVGAGERGQVRGTGRAQPNTGRSMSQQGNLEWAVDTDSGRANGDGRPGKVRRHFSRLAQTQGIVEDRAVGANEVQGERLEGKMSFALVRGRILSRFRMN